MRLFLAIELPEPIREYLAGVRRHLEGEEYRTIGDNLVSWVAPENWHVTLKFLGDVDDPRVADVIDALKEVSVAPMNLLPARMAYFPHRGSVHVVAVEVLDKAGALNQLHTHVEQACEELGFAREGRTFTGHITLGRVKRGKHDTSAGALCKIHAIKLFPGPAFQVESMSLMQSELTPHGSRYTRLATIPVQT
jgi:RNA 2',3'-cyclic 3'-phosphodiesterase